MAAPEKVKLKFYHPRLWGLDPLFENKFKLNIIDVLQLIQYPNYKGVYTLLNHAVVDVWIMGDVLSIQVKEKYIVYRVDDGTGSIRCICWMNDSRLSVLKYFDIKHGDLVTVMGRVSEYDGRKNIETSLIEKETNPNAEVLHWLDIIWLKKTVYNKPFVLSSQSNSSFFVQILKTSFLDYLRSREVKVFSLNQILEEVKDNDIFSYVDDFKDTLNTDDVIHQALSYMLNQGYFIPSKTKTKHYELLSDEDHIIPEIIALFHKMKDYKESSMSATQVTDSLKDINPETYQFLSYERIEQVLQTLVDRNRMYPVDDTLGEIQYRVIT